MIGQGAPDDEAFAAGVKAIGSLLLALACEGVDISTEAYQRAVQLAAENHACYYG